MTFRSENDALRARLRAAEAAAAQRQDASVELKTLRERTRSLEALLHDERATVTALRERHRRLLEEQRAAGPAPEPVRRRGHRRIFVLSVAVVLCTMAISFYVMMHRKFGVRPAARPRAVAAVSTAGEELPSFDPIAALPRVRANVPANATLARIHVGAVDRDGRVDFVRFGSTVVYEFVEPDPVREPSDPPQSIAPAVVHTVRVSSETIPAAEITHRSMPLASVDAPSCTLRAVVEAAFRGALPNEARVDVTYDSSGWRVASWERTRFVTCERTTLVECAASNAAPVP